jgi:O-succinylbenzoic acid--CoA ligase
MRLEINWLWQSCSDRPKQIFLQADHQWWTYEDTCAKVSGLTQILHDLGISWGTRVGVLLNNLPITIFIYLALQNLGAIALCLNYRLSDQEISLLLAYSRADLLISDRQLLTPCPLVHLANLVNSPHSLYPISNSFDPHHIQGIYFTSGTTGKPKAVPLSYFNHWHSAMAVNQFLALDRPHWLLCLPLYHVGGMGILWRTLLAGGTITLVSKFTPEGIIKAVQTANVHLVSLVPTMLKRILASPAFPDSIKQWQSLRGIFLGGASADLLLLNQCLELKLPIILTYGMTETASQITVLELLKYPDKLGSVGQPLPHAQVKIIPSIDSDTYGEIAVKSPALMAGYLGEGKVQFSADGYFLTGDLGYWDRDDFLYLVNRRTDLIVSGGENIYPAEIEQILQRHPLISEVCVVAKSDPLWGEVPAVVITNDQLSLEEIQSFCLRHHLAPYKLPKFVMYMPEIPRIGIGKYHRSLLRELLANN